MPRSVADAPSLARMADHRLLRGGPSPCGQCLRCCAAYTVTVTGSDIWNIADSLKLAPEQFLFAFPLQPGHKIGFKLDRSGANYEVALDKVATEGANGCIFLMELPGGFSRCGIYACRPLVCQIYPAYLDGASVALRHDALCLEGTWKLSHLDLSLWRERLSRSRLEQDLHHYAVARWNRHVEGTEPGRQFHLHDYYSYLMNLYPQVSECLIAIPPQERQQLLHDWGARRNGGNLLELAAGEAKIEGIPGLEELLEEIRRLVERVFPEEVTGSSRDSRNLPVAMGLPQPLPQASPQPPLPTPIKGLGVGA